MASTTNKRRKRSVATSRRRSSQRSRAKTRRPKRIFGLRWHHLGGLGLLLIGLGWLGFALLFQPPGKGSADSCTVSSVLVNSCRPWLGAAVAGYSQVASDTKSQVLYHEQRIGRQLDIVHTYHGVGNNTLSSSDIYFATRPSTYLYANWKPTSNWASIASDNTAIDSMANSIKSVAPNKIFLALHHEPENDVSPGGDPNCPNLPYKGTFGTVADYRTMWAYVEDRFKTDGVSNVVWVMNYMGYPTWDCLLPDMWPGNSLVDWVTFDSYSSSDSSTWDNTGGRVYNLLESDQDATHDFESKPWGSAEFGDCNTSDQAHIYQYYGEVKVALDTNAYPRLKMYMVYDSNGNNSGTGCMTEYSKAGALDTTEQSDYNAFADDPLLTNAHYAPPPTDTTPPTAVITAPANAATISGTTSVNVSATDNVAVSSVSLYVDGSKITTDNASPYNFSLNTTGYGNGTHSLYAIASDDAGNQGRSSTISITISNDGSGSPAGSSSGGSPGSKAGTTTLKVGDNSTNAPRPVSGTLVIDSGQGNAQVSIDGKKTGNTIDTSKLTNGVHTITVVRNGKTMQEKISVHNPWQTALKNELQAHPVAYAMGSSGVVLVVIMIAWLNRFWLLKIYMFIRRRPLTTFGRGSVIRPSR